MLLRARSRLENPPINSHKRIASRHIRYSSGLPWTGVSIRQVDWVVIFCSWKYKWRCRPKSMIFSVSLSPLSSLSCFFLFLFSPLFLSLPSPSSTFHSLSYTPTLYSFPSLSLPFPLPSMLFSLISLLFSSFLSLPFSFPSLFIFPIPKFDYIWLYIFFECLFLVHVFFKKDPSLLLEPIKTRYIVYIFE